MKNKTFYFTRKDKPFRMSPVDIIIPLDNNHNKATRLLESIFRTVYTNRYQISIVDDASDNFSYCESITKIPGVVSFRHKKSYGFGKCINTALQSTKQPWILVMHPDTLVEGNSWLENLGFSMSQLKETGVKMVGPLMNNAECDIQKCNQNEFLEYLESQKKDVILSGDDYLSPACFLCHRELFAKLEQWDDRLSGADIAERMRTLGYKQAVCRGSWIQHEDVSHVWKQSRKKSSFNT